MDITSFDLKSLQQLHQTYQNVLDSHLIKLEQIDKTEANADVIKLLKEKTQSFENNIQTIGIRITQLNDEKLRFSTEYIFWNFGLFSKSFQVSFITTSKAYQIYGGYVTGVTIYEMEEMKILLDRHKAGQWNDGYIRFNDTISDLTNEQRERLKQEGFLASEIDSISVI